MQNEIEVIEKWIRKAVDEISVENLSDKVNILFKYGFISIIHYS